MYRLFEVHKTRKATELSSSLWDFQVLNGEENGMQKTAVPGCWENMPGLGNYRGKAVYGRSFTAGGNVRLEFKGVSHTAEIYVDGEKVKEHYGAFTPFDVVLENLEQGDHKLEVVVSNEFNEKSALHIPNDYMTYGGINRPVVLEELGDAYLKWVHYTTKKCGDVWNVEAKLCLCGLKDLEEVTAAVTLDGKTEVLGTTSLCQGTETILTGSFAMEGAKEWSMEEPNLYPVEAKLSAAGEVIDDLIDRIGFREVTVTGDQIRINGRPIRIKGVCRHEDYSGFGCAIPFTAMQKDIQIIKDLGCNSVRTSHYPNDEMFLDLCDEQGILVWEENHARGLSEAHMKNPNFDWQCELCIREMIQNHYNHPSIYIWGILNECVTDTEFGRSCYAKQLEQIRSMDSSRPRTFATCRYQFKQEDHSLKINDICQDLPEVVSWNVYPQWYFNTDVSRFLKDLHGCVDQTPGKGKPMIISEIGAGAESGFHSAERLKWSEEYQADALNEQLTGVLSDDACTGVYIWQYCDVRVSNEWFASRPRTRNNKGIVDEYRRPKLAYETVKRIFGSWSNYKE
ncbi:MAG: hypothetical protein IJ468_08005 [Lachnospiraceae bacterium]|nr:hypothetical protein [Lachnospiraceae bacterium]